MTEATTITLIICSLILILAIINVLFYQPRKRELSELRAIVHELIGLTPAAEERWGMPEPEEILSELRRLKGDKQ